MQHKTAASLRLRHASHCLATARGTSEAMSRAGERQDNNPDAFLDTPAYSAASGSAAARHHNTTGAAGAPPARRNALPRYIQPGTQAHMAQLPVPQPQQQPQQQQHSFHAAPAAAATQQQQPLRPAGAPANAAAAAYVPPAQPAAAAAFTQSQPPPRPPPVVVPANVMLVSRRQMGNPVLNLIKNVRWEFADIVPDYMIGQNAAALFLSLRYHLLHPDYILHRLKAVQRSYRLMVLLVHVDVEEVVAPLLDITKAAVNCDATLVCAWSSQECARYLETFKSYENKPATAIQERGDTDFMGRVTSTLTSIRGINRKDAFTLASHFNTMAELLQADKEQLADCPGLGPVKVQRLWEAFHQPFRKNITTGIQEQQPGPGGPSSQQPAAEAAGVAEAVLQQSLGAGPSARAVHGQQQQVGPPTPARKPQGGAGSSPDGASAPVHGVGLGQQAAMQQQQQQQDGDDWEEWEGGAGPGGVGWEVAADGAEQVLLLQCTQLAMPMEEEGFDSGDDYEEF